MGKLYAFVYEGTTEEAHEFARRILSADTGHTLSVTVPEKGAPCKRGNHGGVPTAPIPRANSSPPNLPVAS